MKITDLDLAAREDFEKIDDSNARSFLLKPEEVSPLEAYLVLKETFGEPNDEFFDESKSQWSYLLKLQNTYIQIYDWKIDSWSLAVYSEDRKEETGQKIAKSIHQCIKSQVPKFKSKIKDCISKPAGYVIQNPYHLYYQTANELLELVKLGVSSPEALQNTETEQIKFLIRNLSPDSSVCRAAFFLYIASFEGLLNLIYELYLRSSLRDQRIYEHLGREQIDIKLRLAPVYCDCFQDEPVDRNTEEFKKFHSIINLRNDFIHANFTKSMRSPIVVEDGYTFFNPLVDTNNQGLPRNFSELEVEHIEIVKMILDDMVKKLLQHMKPRFRKEFTLAMENEYIEVEYEEGMMLIVR